MRLGNLFTVRVPVDEVWKALLDVERIAPCVPGAQLLEVAGDEFHGVVKVKVGAAEAEYRGSMRVKEIDAAGRRLVVHATGVEGREKSVASATVTAVLTPAGDGTSVTLDTDVALGGRLSQFGSGVMTDVASALVSQFARRLEDEIGRQATASPPAPATGLPEPEAEAVPVTVAPRASYRLAAGLVGVLAAMAVVERRRTRWALAALGVGLIVADQATRPSSMAAVRGS